MARERATYSVRVPAASTAVPVSKEAREQDELYQRAHGMMPPLDEPSAAPPGPR